MNCRKLNGKNVKKNGHIACFKVSLSLSQPHKKKTVININASKSVASIRKICNKVVSTLVIWSAKRFDKKAKI